MTIAWLFLFFIAVCVVVAVTPGEALKVLLALSWAAMALIAFGSIAVAIGQALTRQS